ncbi:MAG: ferrochelatase [Planctomycetota bacterium]|jgi:ferrochelatase
MSDDSSRNGRAADVGIVLLNLGGPWSLDGIRPFLMELFQDREIIRLSPFPFLQPLIARMIVGSRISGIMPGMRYANPRADDAIRAFRRAGVKKAIAVTMYPQYSTATTGSSLNDLERARERCGADDIQWLEPVERYPDQGRYIESMAATVRGALRRVPAKERDTATILFSAHGLPQHFIDDGDPYLDDVKVTTAAILERLKVKNPWRLSFQSRAGPVKWLKPDTDETIRELGAEGCRALVVVPVSFVSDHIETLYEIERLFGDEAREAGIGTFVRVPAMNADPGYASALADLVEERLR